MRFTLVLMSALWVSACLPELSANGANDGDETSDVAEELTVDLQITTSSPDNSDFPYAVKASITGTKGAAYTLKLGEAVIESGNLPSVGAFVGGPFSGSEGNVNTRLVYFVVGDSGSQALSVTVSKSGETATDSFTLSSSGTVCEANENYYANEGFSSDFNCSSCHSPGGTASFVIDGTSYASISSTSKYSSNTPYIMANMPANLDPTPEGNGGELNHSGSLRWSQDSSTHMRMLELAFRASTGFSCP
jgi:hypothetical protein